ncbi:unnamed protein product [Linum trigynum]|uniref:Uncharacterized protein n=1 Tax=Linum trigynum TaxID=586398 RepID=A0AAV2F3P3_9ROSI
MSSTQRSCSRSASLSDRPTARPSSLAPPPRLRRFARFLLHSPARAAAASFFSLCCAASNSRPAATNFPIQEQGEYQQHHHSPGVVIYLGIQLPFSFLFYLQYIFWTLITS